jgi:GNAT superfamily N-acetyltransferase
MYFRQLRESDYRSMRDIFHDAFDRCRLPIVDFGFSWRERSRPHSVGLFTGAGDLVGFAIVSIHPRNWGNRYLDYIAVHSVFRGDGAGSALLQRVVGESHAARCGIHLYPLRRVRAWYKSHGFEFTTAEYMNFHPYPTRQKLKVVKN